MTVRAFLVLAAAAACLLTARGASAENDRLPGHLAVLAGAGQSFPGWGRTTERVKTVDLTFRYAGLINRSHGEGWLRFREQLWIEIPVLWALEPDREPIYCLNFLFCGIAERFGTFNPYVTLGGGPVYAAADIPGMGSRLCGNYQAGVGIRFPGGGWAVHAEARFHHISNMGAADPNVPINSLRGLLGVSRDFY